MTIAELIAILQQLPQNATYDIDHIYERGDFIFLDDPAYEPIKIN